MADDTTTPAVQPGGWKLDGKSLRIRVGDAEYRLAPIGTSICIDIEREIRRMRREEFCGLIEASAKLPSNYIAALITSSLDGLLRDVAASQSDVVRFCASPVGALFLFRQALRAGGQTLTDDAAHAVHDALSSAVESPDDVSQRAAVVNFLSGTMVRM